MYRDLRLRALAEAPDAFGSTHARESERSDEDWAARLARAATAANECPLLAEVDGEPMGLAWGRIDDLHPETAHLYQVWVAPERRGAGVGRALLDAIIAWARSANAQVLSLAVTRGNSPAMRMYLLAGFVSAGEPQPLRDGSVLLSQPMQLVLDD